VPDELLVSRHRTDWHLIFCFIAGDSKQVKDLFKLALP
jgi:hypothetical protein